MPSITSSIGGDRAKNADDTDRADNNNISSDEDSIMSSGSKSPSKAKASRKATTPSRNAKDKQRLNQNKEIPDENENCRVSYCSDIRNSGETFFFWSNLLTSLVPSTDGYINSTTVWWWSHPKHTDRIPSKFSSSTKLSAMNISWNDRYWLFVTGNAPLVTKLLFGMICFPI